MSYPPPPGVASADGTSHPSLPARPPPPKQSNFKSAFTPATSVAPAYTASYPTAQAPVTPQQRYGASYQPSYGTVPPVVNTLGAYGSQTYPQTTSYGPARPGPQPYYGATTTTAPPAIKNLFPVPGQADRNADYDPEMAAQIAQWQSAYSNPDLAATDTKTGKSGLAAAAGPITYGTSDLNATAAPNPDEKKKTVVREGGGKKWSDDTLLEWDPSHFRLFVGNLAGETTDESLLKAFSRWKSVSKARVIRDKRTTKSKGYGFVSFADADDFFQAAKEMNGKYIQSHPVIVRRSTTEIKTTNVKNSKDRQHGKNKNKSKSRGGSFSPHLGPQIGDGIHKPGQKTKGGLKLLG